MMDKLNKLTLVCLAPLGVVYRFFMWVRNLFYNTGIFPSRKLPCKVISIGNINLGGTGKTPAVITLAKHFQKQGVSVAVLSRGYGRNTKKTVLVTDGNDIQSGWRSVGDEAFLMAHSLKAIPIVVDKNRFRGGGFLIKNYNPDIIILDDAFQHRHIKRDIDIVLLNCIETIENYRLIPFGNLREPLVQLKRADMIILSKTNLGDFPEDVHIEQPSGAPLHRAVIEPETYLLDKDKNRTPVHEFYNNKCVLVSGVGSPEGVYKIAETLKLNVVTHLHFRDHQTYTQRDCDRINRAVRKKGGDIILTTEKDMFKLSPVSSENNKLNLTKKVFSLPIKFVFSDKTLDEIHRHIF